MNFVNYIRANAVDGILYKHIAKQTSHFNTRTLKEEENVTITIKIVLLIKNIRIFNK
jgi:hypothetical protein